MEVLVGVVVFVLGLLVGSFLNVVVYRYNTGLSIIYGRSICLSCSRGICWYENIPVVSFVVLRGRCRGCRTKISFQYPLVELMTGFLFLTLWLVGIPAYTSAPMLNLAFALAVASLLVAIFVYDLRHKIIPDLFSFGFVFVALIGLVALEGRALLSYPGLLDLLAGPVLFVPFWALWAVSRGQWIGLGDGKLALGIGWFLGLVSGLSAIILAFWIGAVVSVLLMGVGRVFQNSPGPLRHLGLKSEVPFGPFLIIATLVQFIFHWDFVGLSLFL